MTLTHAGIGVTSEEAKHQAFATGVDGFYSKPVGMKEVKQLLDRLQDVEDSRTRQNT
jgi:CheY-like chemotaxis protein